MSPRARWWSMVRGAQDEALLAVDLYNRSLHRRSYEGFVVHMHIAWTYLLHAEFEQAGVDYRYWNDKHTRLVRVDGEPKTWELATCARYRWGESDPVRKNLEFFVGLRNKIEHRFEEAVAAATLGHAQAHVLNFEAELVQEFGERESLADQLRFPVFLHSFTAQGEKALRDIRARLPQRASRYLTSFHSGLDPAVRDDQRFEFRLHLVPHVGPKTEADLAVRFVREDELSREELEVLSSLGRTGQVIVRERARPIIHHGYLKPGGVVRQVEKEIPFRFSMDNFIQAWRRLKVRPPGNSARPELTDEKYCLWDAANGSYLYTPAFVKKLIRECETEEGFKRVCGRSPWPRSIT